MTERESQQLFEKYWFVLQKFKFVELHQTGEYRA